jgi:hypothetical protein
MARRTSMKKRTTQRALGAIAGLAGLPLVGLALLPMKGLAQERYDLGSGDVAIYNLAGEVEVVSTSGSEVRVTVQTGGGDADRLSVEVGEVRGRMALRVVYPGDEIIYAREGRGRYSTQVRVRDDGTFGGGNGGDRVRIRSSGSGLEAHADLRVEVPEGVDALVYNAVGRAEARGVRADLRLDLSSGPVRVTDHGGRLEIDTGSGSVGVDGVEGEVEVDTGSGSVDISGVNGPRVLVDTGSGSVQGDGIRTGALAVDTGSGRVELTNVRAPDVRVDTGSGSVELELLESVESVEVDTGSGGVTLTLPETLDAEIEVDTGSGGIDVDFPVEVQTMRRNYFRGRVGEGRGRILVDTGSGGIRLRQGS